MIFVSLGHLTLYSIDTYFYALPLGTFQKHVAKGEIARDEQFCLALISYEFHFVLCKTKEMEK